MANERIDQLPTVTAASLSDIIYAVQGYTSPSNIGTSVRETLQQVLSLIEGGSNISASFSGGKLVIAATGLAGIGWTHVTGTTQAMSANSGYIADNAGLVTLTLPATAALGSLIYIQGLGGGGWKVVQNASQQIIIGSSATTVTTGHIDSTNQYDSICLLCVVANTTWAALGAPQGNITLV